MALNGRATFSTPTGGRSLSGSSTTLDLVRALPDIPVLAETLLLMELKAGERAADLREISNLILSDLGATLQIMRLAATEEFSAGGRLTRIEDCVSALGLQACLDAMSRRPLKHSSRQPAVLHTWLHARIIAENSRFLAEEEFPTVNPDEAYLVGLLHTIGLLPAVLGWERNHALSSDPILAGLRIAEAWSLPHCVLNYYADMRGTKASHCWADIVGRAHQKADVSLTRCPAGARFSLCSTALGSIELVRRQSRIFDDAASERQIAFR